MVHYSSSPLSPPSAAGPQYLRLDPGPGMDHECRALIDALWYVSVDINIDTLWIAICTGSTWWSSSGSPVPINLVCCYEHTPQTEISTAPPGRSHPSFEMQRLWKLVALLDIMVRSFQFLFGNRPSQHMIISFCIWIGHGPWLGRNIPSLWYCTTSQKHLRIDYHWPQRLVHYSTATQLHNSLVTCKNKLSFILALVHHFLLWYCTTPQKCPRILITLGDKD